RVRDRTAAAVLGAEAGLGETTTSD
ncbi:MAG: hypothetical protein JWM12_1509, partial [Ilumatobacteraceae bacterium]|nr:hypothetical protein [Ilumatobacteraceae bacterium]